MNGLVNKKSIQSTCKDTGISKTSLICVIKNYKTASENNQDGNLVNFSFCARYVIRQIFIRTEKAMLEKYIINAAKIPHGLPLKMVKTLAHEFAAANSKDFPKSWTKDKSYRWK